MNVLVAVLAGVGGYLVGALSPAALVGRVRRVDLRDHGSGNPGATNAARVLGLRWGVLVGLLDVAKGFLPAALLGLSGEVPGLVAGAAAVAGHVTSLFLRGHGGKGVATTFGAVLGSMPLWGAVLLLVFAVVLAVGRWVALASMSAAAVLLGLALVADVSTPVRLWGAFLAVVILVRHRSNVRRWWSARGSGDADLPGRHPARDGDVPGP